MAPTAEPTGNQPEKRQRDGSPFRQAACIHEPIIERRTNMRTIERQLRARQTAVSLNEKELSRLMKATFDTPRLEQVRDLFIFSSFTGLHYQNLKSLRKENFHNKYGQKWIFMVREQTDAFIHIPLLPVPQMILEKYKVRFAGTDELLPVPSNQRLNVYLKEIAELCGIERT